MAELLGIAGEDIKKWQCVIIGEDGLIRVAPAGRKVLSGPCEECSDNEECKALDGKCSVWRYV